MAGKTGSQRHLMAQLASQQTTNHGDIGYIFLTCEITEHQRIFFNRALHYRVKSGLSGHWLDRRVRALVQKNEGLGFKSQAQ